MSTPSKQISSGAPSGADVDALRAHLIALKLPFMRENYQAYALSAALKQWSHLDYLAELIRLNSERRQEKPEPTG